MLLPPFTVPWSPPPAMPSCLFLDPNPSWQQGHLFREACPDGLLAAPNSEGGLGLGHGSGATSASDWMVSSSGAGPESYSFLCLRCFACVRVHSGSSRNASDHSFLKPAGAAPLQARGPLSCLAGFPREPSGGPYAPLLGPGSSSWCLTAFPLATVLIYSWLLTPSVEGPGATSCLGEGMGWGGMHRRHCPSG